MHTVSRCDSFLFNISKKDFRMLRNWTRFPMRVALPLFAAFAAAGPSAAQTFLPTLAIDPVVGTDRGSASVIRKLDKPAQFLTFSTTGSEVSGRAVLGYGSGNPDLFVSGDQLDFAASLSGLSDHGERELAAGGIAYRVPLGIPGVTGFANFDYGELILGTDEMRALGVRGERAQAVLGIIRQMELGGGRKLRLAAEAVAREIDSEMLGQPVIAEDLRMLRVAALYSDGMPPGRQRRVAVSATRGFQQFGASADDNPLASVPGAQTDFLRGSLALEGSFPLSPFWTANAGIVGQWTEDVLPASQRCGYETNAYSRAFDYALVTGDRCLGGRVELAANFRRPPPGAVPHDFLQGYAGIDRGWLESLADQMLLPGEDTWSSLSVGLRFLQGTVLGELSATRILDRPELARDQDTDRFWIRLAYQF